MDDVSRYLKLYSITNPAHRVHRIAGLRIRGAARNCLSGRMLEIGCGAKHKALLVGDLVTEHIGLDHEDTQHDQSKVDIFGTAYETGVEDGSFDCILSTAVLEHLEEPLLALREAYRVLKPGGYAIYTAPLFWHLHEEPRDFYRYTRYGLNYLFDKSGFQIVELNALSGFCTTFLAEFGYYLQRFRRGPLKPIVDLAVILNNVLAFVLDRGPLRDERFTWMYLVVARKPDVS